MEARPIVETPLRRCEDVTISARGHTLGLMPLRCTLCSDDSENGSDIVCRLSTKDQVGKGIEKALDMKRNTLSFEKRADVLQHFDHWNEVPLCTVQCVLFRQV